MELAGVVLGGLPIALYALDNYHRCLQVTRDYWRYESAIKLIRNHIFIEQQQLHATLRSIGLVNPSRSDVQEHLRQVYPDKCETFMDIIAHMESLLDKLTSDLDIDSRGKPKWSNESPERVYWEWHRVRRSFRKSARQELIKELGYWNNSLRVCFDKNEIPLGSDTPNSTLEAVQSKFNANTCGAIRKQARHVHVAMSRSWRCQSHDHRGNLKLSWHTDGLLQPGKIKVELSSPNNTANASSESWHELDFEVAGQSQNNVPDSSNISQAIPLPLSPGSILHPRKRLKALFQQYSGDAEMADSRSPSPNPPGTVNPQDVFMPPEIGCLCSFVHEARQFGRMKIDDDDTGSSVSLRIHMERRSQNLPVKALPLRSIFAQQLGSPSQMPHGCLLSRKDRFAVAAAATWAVLFLADSPWITPDWNGKDVLYMFYENTAPLTRYYPTISFAFTGLNGSLPPTASSDSEHGLIRNKTLFSLGILLIELCLNQPFEQLRRQSNESSFSASLGVALPTNDYEIANALMQNVYLEAGDFYGYAVQRCLRCEFPGRDVTKSFQFEQFRRDFFSYVVAPVQATYNLLPASYVTA